MHDQALRYSRKEIIKRFLHDAVVGIAFAALTMGCASTLNIQSSKGEPEPMQQEDEEEMQEMLNPDRTQ